MIDFKTFSEAQVKKKKKKKNNKYIKLINFLQYMTLFLKILQI